MSGFRSCLLIDPHVLGGLRGVTVKPDIFYGAQHHLVTESAIPRLDTRLFHFVIRAGCTVYNIVDVYFIH